MFQEKCVQTFEMERCTIVEMCFTTTFFVTLQNSGAQDCPHLCNKYSSALSSRGDFMLEG